MASHFENRSMEPRIQPRTGWHQKPAFHIIGNGWINDPCAPGYDARTKTYHLFYQWNPKGCEWGNMSWGHVTSKDFVKWSSPSKTPVLKPDQPYDKEGVFTGCFYPTGPRGEDGQLSVIYSSVCHLPFHWTTPYPRNPAGISIASSSDGGETWDKYVGNPVVEGEPNDGKVTGFRDPYVAEWAALDQLLDSKSGSLYAVVAGGYVNSGPTAWLYSIEGADLTKWKYLGPMIDIPKPPSQEGDQQYNRWTGDLGHNWECTMFMTLKTEDGKFSREFLLTGTEGSAERRHLVHYPRPKDIQDRSTVSCLWLSGSLALDKSGKVKITKNFSGVMDHGCFYAANSFIDPVSEKRIVIGWLREEDVSLDRCRAKGWTGYLSIPRELYLARIPNIVSKTLQIPLNSLPNIEVVEKNNGSIDILTLGIKPLAQLSQLPSSELFALYDIQLPAGIGDCSLTLPIPSCTNTVSYRLTSTITLQNLAHIKKLGLHINHNVSMSHNTTIFFSPNTEELVLDRSQSNDEPDIARHPEIAPHTLFFQQNLGFGNRAEDGKVELEKLKLDIWVDGDVIEVFANERTAISSLVYCDSETCGNITAFVQLEDGGDAGKVCVVFDSIEVFAGLGRDGSDS